MRPELMEILCCPVDHGELTLEATEKSEKEIVKGTLTCSKCHATYPIDDGIPDLLPPDERD